MDTTELIKNSLDWADKRLTLQDQNLTETQRTYISFVLSKYLVENCVLSGVVKSSHCELYDFGRQDKTCEKKCDSCKWMEGQ